MIGVVSSFVQRFIQVSVRGKKSVDYRRLSRVDCARVAMLCCVAFGLLQAQVYGQETLSRYEFSMPSMGTQLDIVVYAPSRDDAARSIEASVFVLEQESEPINNYAPTSEVSELGRAAPGESRAVSPILGTVLGESLRWHKISDGAFDVTAGALTKLWRDARKKKVLPSNEELHSARESSGWGNLSIERKRDDSGAALSAISFQKSGMSIDVGGIATGYLLDRMMATLQEKGIRHALINAGGDILVSQPPPGKAAWTIDIAGISKSSPPLLRLELADAAVTTSGDLYQFVEIDGRRYSHLISPKRGEPIELRQSVTVVAKRAIDADAGATALAVLGAVESYARFESLPIDQVIFLTQDSDTLPPTMRMWSRGP